MRPFETRVGLPRKVRYATVASCIIIGFFALVLSVSGASLTAAPIGAAIEKFAAVSSTTLLHRTTSSTAPRQVRNPVLRDGASIPPRAVVRLTMLTSELGVALAMMPPSATSTGRFYLARTYDGGTSWTVSGRFSRDVVPSVGLSPMAFESLTEGYMVFGGTKTHTEFTDNGGATWSTVKVPGQSTDLSIAAGSLWITADQCRRGTTNVSVCPTELARYVVGARSPTEVSRVPVEGPAFSASLRPRAIEATLWARQGDEGLVSEGIEGLYTSILETADSGQHWTVIPDPCQNLQVAGILELSTSHLLLLCELDLGMHQGVKQLWTTTDDGQDWALSAQGSVEDPAQDVGNIGAGMVDDLTASGSGSILWTLEAVDGLGYSTDGGSSWAGVPLETQGYLSQIVTMGADEAWLPLPGLGLYRTLNGTEWTQLP
jgi:hypothetical protein